MRAGVARLRAGCAHLGPALKRVLLRPSGGPSGQASCGCPGQPALPAPSIVQTPGAGSGAFGVLSGAPLGVWGFVDAQAAEAAEGCVEEESAGSGAQRAPEAQSGRSCWHSHCALVLDPVPCYGPRSGQGLGGGGVGGEGGD